MQAAASRVSAATVPVPLPRLVLPSCTSVPAPLGFGRLRVGIGADELHALNALISAVCGGQSEGPQSSIGSESFETTKQLSCRACVITVTKTTVKSRFLFVETPRAQRELAL